MPKRFGLTLEDWPAPDRTAWQRGMTPTDVLDDAAVASSWRPKTCDQARYAYGRWLEHLEASDRDALVAPPADRVTCGRIRGYVDRLSARVTTMSVAAELQHLILALRVVAPTGDWTWLRRLQGTIQRQARPRDKRAKVVDPRRLVALGDVLMDRANMESRVDARARLFRDGLMIALLAMRPLRRRSFALLELERNVLRVGDHFVIVLAATDTKSGVPVEFDVPQVLTSRLLEYLDRFRPLFPKATESTALWLSSKGGALSADAIYATIKRRTAAAFGFSIHPHLFRDIAVTAIAREAPGDIGIASDLLTHAKLETTERYDARARTVEAALGHAATIEHLRQGLGMTTVTTYRHD